GRVESFTEVLRAGTATAMLHSWDHVKTREGVRGGAAHFCDHALIVVHGIERRNRGIVPAVIEDQLASARPEGTKVGIGSVERLSRFLGSSFHAAIDSKDFVIPVLLVVDHVGVVSQAEVGHKAPGGSGASNPERPATLAFLCPGKIARKNGLAARVAHAGIDSLECSQLRGSEALICIRVVLALDRCRIEVALAGVVQNAVSHSVEFVACRNNSFAQNRDFGRRYETGRCCCDRLGVNNGEGEQARPVVCRRTGKDTVVVLWITLRLHQSFATAVGAPSEVGALRCGAVERRDDGFGDASHFMNASITEVDDLRRMAQSPSSVDGRAGASRVRASGNVAMLERGSEFEVIDGASEAAVRETLKLAIPILE